MFFHELDGLVREALGQILSLLAVLEGGNPIGREVAGRAAPKTAADVHVKSLMLGPKAGLLLSRAIFPPVGIREVPFADMGGGVAGRFEVLGNGHVIQGEIPDSCRFLEVRSLGREPVFVSRSVIGQPQPRRRLPGHHGRACRGTNRGRRIAIGESHAFPCQLVEVRGVHLFMSIAMQVHPAQVVGHDDDDVGPDSFDGAGDRGGNAENRQE